MAEKAVIRLSYENYFREQVTRISYTEIVFTIVAFLEYEHVCTSTITLRCVHSFRLHPLSWCRNEDQLFVRYYIAGTYTYVCTKTEEHFRLISLRVFAHEKEISNFIKTLSVTVCNCIWKRVIFAFPYNVSMFSIRRFTRIDVYVYFMYEYVFANCKRIVLHSFRTELLCMLVCAFHQMLIVLISWYPVSWKD